MRILRIGITACVKLLPDSTLAFSKQNTMSIFTKQILDHAHIYDVFSTQQRFVTSTREL